MSHYRTLPDLKTKYVKGQLVGWGYIDRNEINHSLHALNGRPLSFGKSLPKDVPLPSLFNARTLVGDLIPQTSWGSSLANLLTRNQWNALRYPVIERNQGVCEYCGKHVGKSLEVHENWRYHVPEGQTPVAQDQYLFGRQELIGLLGVCKSCHACFHLGLANVRGHLDKTLLRLRQINGWNQRQCEEYLSELYERHHQLNAFYWYLDCSFVAPMVETLVVQSTWTRTQENPNILTKDSQYGTNVALIAGCAWRLNHESHSSYLSSDA